MRLLTNLLFEPKGMHNQNAAYNIKDTVMSGDGSRVYFAIQDVPAGIPLNDSNYWKLQIDLSSSKSAMDQALVSFADYAKAIGTRVKGETARASGNPVTFLPDAGSLLQPVTVLDVQQHGSGDPYPAGGGIKNKFTGWVRGENINPANGAFGANASGARTGYIAVSPSAYMMISGLTETLFFFAAYYDANKNFIDRTGAVPVSSLPIQTPDNCAYIALTQYENPTVAGVISDLSNAIQIEYGTSITEYEEWENIRPFIGYDALNLGAAGKNLLPTFKNYTLNGITMTVAADGTITLNGTSTGDGFTYLIQELNLPAGSYALSLNNGTAVGSSGADTVYCVARDAANGWTAQAYCVQSNAVGVGSTEMEIVDFMLVVPAGVTLNNYKMAIQLEAGSTVTEWKPYQGKLHTVQIGQTVYGFRYEWLTGKGLIEWAILTLTGEEVIERNSGWVTGAYFISGILPNAVPIDGYHTVADIVCSHGVTKTPDNIANGQIGIGQGSISNLYLNFGTQYNTEESFRTLLAAQHAAGTPVQIAYKLATPIEIQLTPHIITAADPEQTNTLYGDGRIAVEYVKPLHVSIEERVAAAVAAAMNTEGV